MGPQGLLQLEFLSSKKKKLLLEKLFCGIDRRVFKKGGGSLGGEKIEKMELRLIHTNMF